jgi:hypothetical protein
MTEDPYIKEDRSYEYEGFPVIVSSVTTDLTAEITSCKSRLICGLYTDGENDLTIAKYRNLAERKEAFAKCKGKWHLEKIGDGPWQLLKRKDHTCHFQACGTTSAAVSISASAPALVSSSMESIVKNRRVKKRARGKDILPDTLPSLSVFRLPEDVYSEFVRNSDSLRSQLERLGNKWRPITGGDSQRWFLPDAATDPEIWELLEGPTRWVREYISKQYPSLKHFRLGAIKSGPNAPSQYAGHNYRLHSDFDDKVCSRFPKDRPLSFMIALDRFELISLPHNSLTRDDVVITVVDPGEVIIFTNTCLHSGGKNKTQNMVYRIFGYVASDEADFPPNKVYLKNRETIAGDAVLSTKKARK